MKKQLTRFGFFILIIAAVAFTASTQQEKDKNNEKKQQQNQGKKEVKNNQAKKDMKDNNGKNDMKDNNGKNDNNIKGNNGKNEEKINKNNRDRDYGYEWNRETFKDRRKFKNNEKVIVCHKFNRDNEPGVSIRVSSNALKAHMNHGDIMGDCPHPANHRFSDNFESKRVDYYNYIQESEEQVVYSQSILDYALSRLADSRMQLVTYRNNNMPLVEIERKQVIVMELEQNVSLLETLLGAAANLLVNKLQ